MLRTILSAKISRKVTEVDVCKTLKLRNEYFIFRIISSMEDMYKGISILTIPSYVNELVPRTQKFIL